jgi:hypothetical protein
MQEKISPLADFFHQRVHHAMAVALSGNVPAAIFMAARCARGMREMPVIAASNASPAR